MNNKTAESNLKSNEIKSNPKKMRLDLNKLQKKSSREQPGATNTSQMVSKENTPDQQSDKIALTTERAAIYGDENLSEHHQL